MDVDMDMNRDMAQKCEVECCYFLNFNLGGSDWRRVFSYTEKPTGENLQYILSERGGQVGGGDEIS
jgi:hypothetical protein